MHNYKITIEYGIALSLYRLHQRDPEKWYTAAEISNAISARQRRNANVSPRRVTQYLRCGATDQYIVTEKRNVQTMRYSALYRFVRGVHPDFVGGDNNGSN